MKAIVFDPFSGASGDMLVGTLIDLGADREAVVSAMTSVNICDVGVDIERISRCGITATRVKVTANDAGDRSYYDVVKVVDESGLDNKIIEDVVSVFKRIASAESIVHGKPLEDMIFHEVGSADAIADVIGACTALHDLDVNNLEVYSTQVSVGGGFTECGHGRLPVPAPATMQILQESCLIWRGGPVERELLTPTGAALLAHYVRHCLPFYPKMRVYEVGYGAGDYDMDVPNALRSVIADIPDDLVYDDVEMLETNVDDVTGEVLGYLIDDLLSYGALDISVIPATMKKGRSGHVIKVVCKPADSVMLAGRIMRQTGSLGVRILPVRHRLIALRRSQTISVEINGEKYNVSVKIATDAKGNLIDVSAEFDDVIRVAKQSGVPIKQIIRMAEDAAMNYISL